MNNIFIEKLIVYSNNRSHVVFNDNTSIILKEDMSKFYLIN